jgi:hypothetical protein
MVTGRDRLSYADEINIDRREFELLKERVAETQDLLHRTRIVLHGEDGTNGLRSSVERAHHAIGELRNSVKMANDGIAALALESHSGDKEMEIMVLRELQKLGDKTQKQTFWMIGLFVTMVLGIGSILVAI